MRLFPSSSCMPAILTLVPLLLSLPIIRLHAAAAEQPVATIPDRVPSLGITPEVDVWSFNHRADGLAISAIATGQTAEALRAKPGDVIVRVDGRPADNLNLLNRAVAGCVLGGRLTIEVLRDGKPLTLTGTMLGRLRDPDAVPLPWKHFRDSDPLRQAFFSGDVGKYQAVYDQAEREPESRQQVLRFGSTTDTDTVGIWMSEGPTSLRLDQLRGKRVRFSAEIRTQDVTSGCNLWIGTRAFIGDSDALEQPSFDNMEARLIRGTTAWQSHAAVVDVPRQVINVSFGLRMKGTGSMWARKLLMEEVGTDVPSTSMSESCAATNAQARQAWEAVQAAKGNDSNPVLPARQNHF